MKRYINTFIINMPDFWIVSAAYLLTVLALPIWIDIPLNDDWVYALDVLETSRRNSYWITGFELAWAIPQTLIGVLGVKYIGFSHIYLRWVGILSLVGVLLFSSKLMQEYGLSWRIRAFVLMSFAFYPPMFIVSLSYMTDIPFLFLWMATLYFWTKAVKQQSSIFTLTGSFFCLLAVMQRQIGISLVIAILFAVWRNKRWQDLKKNNIRIMMFSCIVILFIFLVINLLWSIVGGQEVKIEAIDGYLQSGIHNSILILIEMINNKIMLAIIALLYCGFMFLPLAVIIGFMKKTNVRTVSIGKRRVSMIIVFNCLTLLVLSSVLALTDLYMPYHDCPVKLKSTLSNCLI